MDAKALSKSWRAVRLTAILAVACAGAGLTAKPALAGSAIPAKVRFGGDLAATRIVLDVPQQIDGRVVTADARKLVIDFPRLSVDAGSGKGQGLVDSWSMD